MSRLADIPCCLLRSTDYFPYKIYINKSILYRQTLSTYFHILSFNSWILLYFPLYELFDGSQVIFITMDRDIPNFNPIVVGRMQQKQLQLHQQRLQNIKVSTHICSLSINRGSPHLPIITVTTRRQCSSRRTKRQKYNATTSFSSIKCSKSRSATTLVIVQSPLLTESMQGLQ